MPTVIDKPTIEISPELKELIKHHTQEMGQVVVHLALESISSYDQWIRIWPTTYLYDQGSAHTSDLVHIENIVYHPHWQLCPAGKVAHFTLIFAGLPRSCATFDLIEHCTNQSGAFEVRDIARNNNDVYYLKM